jgi:hypothetical protein
MLGSPVVVDGLASPRTGVRRRPCSSPLHSTSGCEAARLWTRSRWIVPRTVDDAACGVGAWRGGLRHRNVGPLLPSRPTANFPGEDKF